MNKRDLEQLRALKFEIKSLSLEMLKPKPTLQPIFYKDYRTGKGIPKTDVGYDYGDAEKDRLERLYRKKYGEQLALVEKMERWLETIKEPQMRAILRYYYRDGLSQREIGEMVGYEQSVVSRKLKTFWKMIVA